METVLRTYAEPVDPEVPLLCVDEAGKELRRALRPDLPATPGRPRAEDPEYVRLGSANLFMCYAPHLGWRQVTVTTDRTAKDFAVMLRDLVDIHFPAARRLIVVLDNLNTHSAAALYATFPPEEAERIACKLEFRHTPTHGSWLNMAEIELSVLARQCLAARIPDAETLATTIAAWTAHRNAVAAPARWTFTVTDARQQLPRLYPTPSCAR
jgi:hypothetical protein